MKYNGPPGLWPLGIESIVEYPKANKLNTITYNRKQQK
jgi:hypothetical protein